MTTITDKHNVAALTYVVSMPDGSKYAVPVSAIITSRVSSIMRHRGCEAVYDEIFNEVVEEFDDHSNIIEWARGNMDWEDVMAVSTRVKKPDTDYNEGWINGEVEII